ncbi:hypothetical protein ACWCQ0_48955 [Streptomyces massasporeus]
MVQTNRVVKTSVPGVRTADEPVRPPYESPPPGPAPAAPGYGVPPARPICPAATCHSGGEEGTATGGETAEGGPQTAPVVLVAPLSVRHGSGGHHSRRAPGCWP